MVNARLLLIKFHVIYIISHSPNIRIYHDCISGKQSVFLDALTRINPNNQHIITKIHEKPLNEHIYLQQKSNNPHNHKFAIFNAMFFRDICLNDDVADFYELRKNS